METPMKRTCVVACAAGAAILIAAWGVHSWQAKRPDAGATHGEEEPPNPDLDRRIAAVSARISAKRYVASEVIANRLSLLDAAAAFRRFDAEEPSLPPSRDRSPGCTSDDEACCRSVLQYVANEAAPDRAKELTRRLGEELESRLHEGTLHLPAP